MIFATLPLAVAYGAACWMSSVVNNELREVQTGPSRMDSPVSWRAIAFFVIRHKNVAFLLEYTLECNFYEVKQIIFVEIV